MAHPRWPGFGPYTGNPKHDNEIRNANRFLWKTAQNNLRFKTPGGRKRKKELTRVEGGNYVKLLVATMNDLARGSRR